MLVYITVFSMTIVVCAKLFVNTTRLSLYSTQIVDRMNEVREVQRDFLETVRAAAAVAPGVGEHRTGENTLVLQLHCPGEPPRYAVLSMFDSDRLRLLEVVEEAEGWRAATYKTWRLPLAAARFEVDATKRRVTLALTTAPRNPQRPEAGRERRFVAALRTGAVKETDNER